MPEGIDAVLELFPKESRTTDFKSALGKLEVTDMATLAGAVVKGGQALNQASELAGSKTELEAKLAGAIIPPGENATPEEVSAYKQRLGVPSEISGYGLTELEATEEGQKTLGAYLKAGVPKDVAVNLLQESSQIQSEYAASMQARLAADLKLKLADAGENAAVFQKSGAEVLFPGDQNAAVRERILSDPDMAQALVMVGKANRENPRQFQNNERGGVAGSPYKGMEARGYR
jgi:hypothetical protein